MLISRKPRATPPRSDLGTVIAAPEAGKLRVSFAGRWDVNTVMAQERDLAEIRAESGRPTEIDVSGVTLLDTVGAIAVARVRERLAEAGPANVVGVHDSQAGLLDQVSSADSHLLPEPTPPTIVDRIAALGAWATHLGHDARDLIGFYGELLVVLWRIIRNPRRLRLTSMINQMQRIGIDAMPIVGLLAFLIGIVLADLSADQLKRFGAGILVVNLLGISILRELGIFLTAVMVAGRSGSAFAAEIGTMKINQEIDAMRTIGLDPMEVLVVPRVAALILILIPLGFFASIVMLVGGAITADFTLGITLRQFLENFRAAVETRHLWVGIVKAPFFAFVIAMVGCYHGLEVSGSAESVGRHTTQSVVWSIFLVILLDALFAVLFLRIGF
jgi:phospholipid/cholesterol/gamma-HCH transport system permease protein